MKGKLMKKVVISPPILLTFFPQENKYKEAVGFYEPIVKKHYDNVSTSFYLLRIQKLNCVKSKHFERQCGLFNVPR